MWILNISTNLLSSLDHLGVHRAPSVQTFDFSTLYTSILHDLLKSRMNNIINNCFQHKNGAPPYTHIKVGRNESCFANDPLNGDNKYTANDICKMIEFWWITYMLGLVDSFSDKWLDFLWKQTVSHYWLSCFSIPTKMSFWINSLRKAKESLLQSSIYHTVVLMTLSLSIIKDLRNLFLIFTPKNSQFLKPQNLLQLLLFSICFSPEIKSTI